MMDWTDRHCRYFLRGFSPRVLLYTEMITAAAIKHGDRDRLLGFDPEEHPVALQLGGSEPRALAEAARAGEDAGYDEINLNCGCPSDRVSSGSFGACLMKDPDRVADCVAAMRAVVRVPVTVKMRIGVVATHDGELREDVHKFDERDFEALSEFVRKTGEAGSAVSIVHARKAVLGGLSPKDNREIPPLRYDVVRRVKATFPQMPMVVNGGLKDARTALEALKWGDGVMFGREAYHRPFVLREIHDAVYGAAPQPPPPPPPPPPPQEAVPEAVMSRQPGSPAGAAAFTSETAPTVSTRRQLAERMASYAERRMRVGDRLSTIARHMLGLYSGQPGAREYRRVLSEGSRGVDARPELILIAADCAERS